jgi:hypothetical protein
MVQLQRHSYIIVSIFSNIGGNSIVGVWRYRHLNFGVSTASLAKEGVSTAILAKEIKGNNDQRN